MGMNQTKNDIDRWTLDIRPTMLVAAFNIINSSSQAWEINTHPRRAPDAWNPKDQGVSLQKFLVSRSPWQVSSQMRSVSYLQQGLVWKDCSVAHHVSTCSQASNARGYPKKCQVQPQWLVAQEMPVDAENLDSLSCNRVWAPKNASTSYNML
jgi:hypothetical protein